MAIFSYKARDANGLLVVGQIEGETVESVRDMLGEQGLIPISATRGATRLSKDFSLLDAFKTVQSEELMLFTRQFQTLFKAGMDMGSLLSTLAKQTNNKYFADVLSRIKTDVDAGSSLSRAFSQHPKIFNQLYTNMLAAGEEAGILDEVLEQLSKLLEKENTLKASVKSATLYPKIVVFVLIFATSIIMTYVVPKFATFYSHYEAELPLPTRIMMGVSYVATNYWYLVLGAIALMWLAFRKWQTLPQGRVLFDKFKWSLPVFGVLGQKVANARFANILGALYRSGLSITRGLEITAETIDNAAFNRNILLMKSDVEKGRGIAEAMRDKQYFSPLLIESTAIGERSGALDNMYAAIGAHYDMEVNNMLKNLTTLIEPLLLFMVFGMVTLFALAIFLPMWNLSSVVMH